MSLTVPRMFICLSRVCPLLPVGVLPVGRRTALFGPVLRAFSINHLFLFADFVSWTIIDRGECPTAPRASSGYCNKEGGLGAEMSLWFCFPWGHWPLHRGREGGRLGGGGDQHPRDFVSTWEIRSALTLKFGLRDCKMDFWMARLQNSQDSGFPSECLALTF